MGARHVERILVVEDHDGLREQLRRALARRGAVTCAASVTEAKRCIAEAVEAVEAAAGEALPDLVLLDVQLPDGTAFDVLAALASISPAPVVIVVSGSATTPEGFRLAQLGVRAFLHKPLDLAELDVVIDKALAEAPDIATTVRGAVGHASLEQIEDAVRDVLVDEALARSGGSKHGAARLLEITRQRLQHILRKRS